jgi:hypothetical protein
MATSRRSIYPGGNSRPRVIDRHTSRSPGGYPSLQPSPTLTDHDLRLPYYLPGRGGGPALRWKGRLRFGGFDLIMDLSGMQDATLAAVEVLHFCISKKRAF